MDVNYLMKKLTHPNGILARNMILILKNTKDTTIWHVARAACHSSPAMAKIGYVCFEFKGIFQLRIRGLMVKASDSNSYP